MLTIAIWVPGQGRAC